MEETKKLGHSKTKEETKKQGKQKKEETTKYRMYNLKEQTDLIATFSRLTTSSSSDHETGNHLLKKLEVVSFLSGKN